MTCAKDIPTNIATGVLFAAYSDYMFLSISSGKTPFLYSRGKNRLNFSFKQHLVMQLILLLAIVVVSGSVLLVIYVTKQIRTTTKYFIGGYASNIKNRFVSIKSWPINFKNQINETLLELHF